VVCSNKKARTLLVMFDVSHRDDVGWNTISLTTDNRVHTRLITRLHTQLITRQLQPNSRSRFKLFKNVNPTFSVYIIVLCPENDSNDTVTGLNLIPGTDKICTYLTPARFPVFEWVLYQEHTFTDRRQNTRNRWQYWFLPLVWRMNIHVVEIFFRFKSVY